MTSVAGGYTRYGIYDLSTGQINRTLTCRAGSQTQEIRAGEALAEFTGDAQLMFRNLANGTWVAKTNGPLVASKLNPVVNEVVSISNVPAPCKLWINDRDHDIAVGETTVVLDFDEIGEHRVVLDAAAYLKQELIFNVQ